jgi:hypothetical protein
MTVPDFTPQPDEVTSILRRAHRRRSLKAAEVLGGLGLALLLVAATTAGGGADGRAGINVVDGPSPSSSGSASAAASPGGGIESGDPGESAQPQPQPSGGSSEAPSGGGDEPSSSSSAAAGGSPQRPRVTRLPTVQRTTVSGRGATEGGCQTKVIDPTAPTQSTVGDIWCLIIDARTPTGSGSGQTVHPFGGGASSSTEATSDFYWFAFSVCRQADAEGDLRLSFDDDEEVDFRVRQGSDGPIVWTFSTLRPSGGTAHALVVHRSDCIQWQINWDPVDEAGAPLADGEYVIEGQSLAPEIADTRETGIYFTVGDEA